MSNAEIGVFRQLLMNEIEQIQRSFPLKTATPPAWVQGVLENIDHFLADHASCERKAHAAAMMLAYRFSESPHLQDTMIELAIEELEHLKMVLKLLRARSLNLSTDEADLYVKKLMLHVRHPRKEHLIDRLLVAALVEARSCERFCQLALALPEGELKNFYEDFAKAEAKHFPLFLELANHHGASEEITKRFDELLAIEAQICEEIPIRPTVH